MQRLESARLGATLSLSPLCPKTSWLLKLQGSADCPAPSLGGRTLQGSEDGFGSLSVGEMPRINPDAATLLIERFPCSVEFGEGLSGIVGLEERALAMFDPLVELVGVGIEPDDWSDLWKNAAVFFRADNPSTSGNHETNTPDESPENSCFDFPKIIFAVLAEDFWDRHLRLLYDEVVRIKKSEPSHGGQDSTDAGFAGSHESNEYQIVQHCLDLHHIEGFGSPITRRYFKLNRVSLLQSFKSIATNFGIVHENISVSSAGVGNKSEAFFVVKPFYCSLRHKSGVRF